MTSLQYRKDSVYVREDLTNLEKDFLKKGLSGIKVDSREQNGGELTAFTQGNLELRKMVTY